MTEPNDRELEQYLKGDSALSRRYRDASRESAPPELDETVLARARAEARRKPRANRWLASVALAASLVLGVNLAWNLYEAQPVPVEQDAVARRSEPAPASAPPAAPEQRAPEAAPASKAEAARQDRAAAAVAERKARVAARENEMMQLQARDEAARGAATAPRAADFPPATEAQKIERLIVFVAGLQDAVFIRDGTAHTPEQAAAELRNRLAAAGDRVVTAHDFIRLCASHAVLGSEAYQVRYADGRTRTAEDVLREFLGMMEGAP